MQMCIYICVCKFEKYTEQENSTLLHSKYLSFSTQQTLQLTLNILI